MGKALYMQVTHDKYELPLAVADSIAELARLRGVSDNSIYSAMSNARKYGYNSIYVKVDLEGEDV